MQTEQDQATNAKFTYGVARIFFPLMLLLALDGLVTAERAGTHGLFPAIHDWWYVRLAIVFPWIGTVLCGAILWQHANKKNLDRNIAATLLMLLGFIASCSYEVLGKFAGSR